MSDINNPNSVFTEARTAEPLTMQGFFRGVSSPFGDRYELKHVYDGGLFGIAQRVGNNAMYLAELRPPFIGSGEDNSSRTARIGTTQLDIHGQMKASLALADNSELDQPADTDRVE